MSAYAGDPDFMRTPPQSIDAEQAVLGALMLRIEALPKIADFLSESDFYRKDHRLIYRAITEMDKRRSPCDAVTLSDWFADNDMGDMIGGPSYLIELANNTPSAANIVAYAEIVTEKSRLRSVIDTGTKVIEAAYAARDSSQIIVADASHRLAQMSSLTSRGGLEPAKIALRQMHQDSLRRYEQYQTGVSLIGQPWPWDDLNRITSGMCDETLYIVGARPSMGKTVFGLQAAVCNALAGNRTAFFSVEMSASQIMGRAVAAVGNIPHAWVKQPRDDMQESEDYWASYSRTIGAIGESDFLIDETPSLSVHQMYARARRAHMQKPLRLIVVDHMHDMLVDANNARFDYGVITQMCKTMAKEFRCPVICLAQLNRGSTNRTDKRPMMSDLRESGEIEQKADVILFLHRDDYYDPSKSPGVVEVIPAKGRDIETGTSAYLSNDFARMRMGNYSGDVPDSFIRFDNKSKKSNSFADF